MTGKQAGWAVARQPGSLAAAAFASAAVIGVSAFAFQGTNAHAVMTAAEAAGATASKPNANWARHRFWVAPRPHTGALVGSYLQACRHVPAICWCTLSRWPFINHPTPSPFPAPPPSGWICVGTGGRRLPWLLRPNGFSGGKANSSPRRSSAASRA